MPSRLWSGFACLEFSISAKAEGGLSLCKTMTIRRLTLFTFAAPAKRSRSPRNSTIHFIRKPTASVTRNRDHGRCMCPYCFIWRCDGDCLDCEYHATGDITSLDQPLSDGNGTLCDYMPNRSKSMEEIISDRMLLEQLFARLRELDPDADIIIQCWLDDYKISIVQSLKSSVARSVPSLIR